MYQSQFLLEYCNLFLGIILTKTLISRYMNMTSFFVLAQAGLKNLVRE